MDALAFLLCSSDGGGKFVLGVTKHGTSEVLYESNRKNSQKSKICCNVCDLNSVYMSERP